MPRLRADQIRGGTSSIMTDKWTEVRRDVVPVIANEQSVFPTHIPIGVEYGIANFNTISIEVNGVLQVKDVDYSLDASNDTPPELIITWKSTDFSLDTTDTFMVVYEILLSK